MEKNIQCPSYTPNAPLRGEAGASSTKSRDMALKLNYVTYIVRDGNDLLRKFLKVCGITKTYTLDLTAENLYGEGRNC